MNASDWSGAARIEAADALTTEVDGEAVLLHPEQETYYGLNETGSCIWQWLEEPRSFRALRERLEEQYELSREEATTALETFLEDLHRAGLVTVDTT